MGYSISVLHKADIHILKATESIHSKNPKQVAVFLKTIDSTIKYIQKNPLKCQVRYRDIRINFIHHFQIGIHYVVRDKNIRVIGVFFMKQDSESW